VQSIDRSFQPLIPIYVDELGGGAGRVGFWSGLTVSLSGAAMAIAANAMARLSPYVSPVRLLLIALAGGRCVAPQSVPWARSGSSPSPARCCRSQRGEPPR